MMFHRPGRLRVVLLCSSIFSTSAIFLEAQQPAAQQQPPPQQQPAPQQPAPQPNKPNPFETVPQTPAQPPKQDIQNVPPPKPEAPRATQPGQPPEDVIEAIEFRGARRVRQDTLQAIIQSKKGDKYDEDALHRDFILLWNSGRFDDIRVEREPGKEGWIIRYIVVERP